MRVQGEAFFLINGAMDFLSLWLAACVGRARCAMPEIIDEGENGELVHSSDPVELAEKISRICEDPALYAAYSQSAMRKAEQFTWDKTAERMLDAMRSAN